MLQREQKEHSAILENHFLVYLRVAVLHSFYCMQEDRGSISLLAKNAAGNVIAAMSR